ncbi:hypothetical protein M407DRAFT_29308 [Tulasnella calospora MUT 4182]|uniref:Uncharacterized protein n=1 Tax=Tulasnella calospora MUT 4182 TaxID=1051891 RepID=A0A0C3LHX8_9AGAM|nr:hypothetical protein M407DRAFT_29308 [Tulasnella calospora MUT 4182]
MDLAAVTPLLIDVPSCYIASPSHPPLHLAAVTHLLIAVPFTQPSLSSAFSATATFNPILSTPSQSSPLSRPILRAQSSLATTGSVRSRPSDRFAAVAAVLTGSATIMVVPTPSLPSPSSQRTLRRQSSKSAFPTTLPFVQIVSTPSSPSPLTGQTLRTQWLRHASHAMAASVRSCHSDSFAAIAAVPTGSTTKGATDSGSPTTARGRFGPFAALYEGSLGNNLSEPAAPGAVEL